MFRYHLLGLLRNGTQHGYALAKEYQRRSGIEVGLGGIYRELRILTEQGLVRRLSSPVDGDPRRTPYEITTDGREAFEDWFRELPDSTACDESSIAVRVMFFGDVSPEDGHRALEQWRAGLWGLSKRYEAQLSRALTRDPAGTGSCALLLRRRMKHIAVELEFLDAAQAALPPAPASFEPFPEERAYLDSTPIARRSSFRS
jgi:DNA-binding PadR family transcriptional regulator